MDPVTAFQVAAAAAQFAQLGVQISSRIHKFTKSLDQQLPEPLGDLLKRIEVLDSCLRDIQRHLEAKGRDKDRDEGISCSRKRDAEDTLQAFTDLISAAQRRCEQLMVILDDYMPKDGEGSGTRILKAFRSIASDERILKISKSLSDDVGFVILRQMTSLAQSGTASQSNNAIGTSARQAHPLSGRTFNTVPHRQVKTFVARKEVLDRIDVAMQEQSGAEPRVVIIKGMGGQGKTQLALEYCRGAKRNRRYSGIFWVDADSAQLTAQSFKSISSAICPDQSFDDTELEVHYVKRMLQSWEEPWLVVFDNYDDPHTFALADFFPVAANGHVLITSRHSDTSRLGEVVELSGMEEDQAGDLLFSLSGVRRTDENESYAVEIVKRLGYLPLAIDQAGAYLREREGFVPIKEFLAQFQSSEESMEEIFDDVPAGWEYLNHSTPSTEKNAKTVFTTWNLSLNLLAPDTKAGKQKVAILTMLAFFDNNDISEELFRAFFERLLKGNEELPPWASVLTAPKDGSWSPTRFQALAAEFKKLSLVSGARKKDDGFIHFNIHPLVRDWMLLRLDKERMRECWEWSTRMLGSSLLKHHWALDNGVPWDQGFRLSPAATSQFLAHLMSWEAKLASLQRKMTLRPGPRTAHDCYLFAMLYSLCGSSYRTRATDLCTWIWDSLDSIRREQAGASTDEQQIWKLPDLDATQYAASCLRANVQMHGSVWWAAMATKELSYWQRQGVDPSILGALRGIEWLGKLMQTLQPGEMMEEAARGIEEEFKAPPVPADRRSALALKHSLLLGLCGCLPTGSSGSQVSTIVKDVTDESEAMGGRSYRERYWSSWEYNSVSCSHPKLETREALAHEFLAVMETRYGEHHSFWFQAHNALSFIMARRREHGKYIAALQDSVVRQVRGGMYLENGLRSSCRYLAVGFWYQKRESDCVDFFLELLRANQTTLRSETVLMILECLYTTYRRQHNSAKMEEVCISSLRILDIVPRGAESDAERAAVILSLCRAKSQIFTNVCNEATAECARAAMVGLDEAVEIFAKSYANQEQVPGRTALMTYVCRLSGDSVHGYEVLVSKALYSAAAGGLDAALGFAEKTRQSLEHLESYSSFESLVNAVADYVRYLTLMEAAGQKNVRDELAWLVGLAERSLDPLEKAVSRLAGLFFIRESLIEHLDDSTRFYQLIKKDVARLKAENAAFRERLAQASAPKAERQPPAAEDVTAEAGGDGCATKDEAAGDGGTRQALTTEGHKTAIPPPAKQAPMTSTSEIKVARSRPRILKLLSRKRINVGARGGETMVSPPLPSGTADPTTESKATVVG